MHCADRDSRRAVSRCLGETSGKPGDNLEKPGRYLGNSRLRSVAVMLGESALGHILDYAWLILDTIAHVVSRAAKARRVLACLAAGTGVVVEHALCMH